jgi:hypothetical protein
MHIASTYFTYAWKRQLGFLRMNARRLTIYFCASILPVPRVARRGGIDSSSSTGGFKPAKKRSSVSGQRQSRFTAAGKSMSFEN